METVPTQLGAMESLLRHMQHLSSQYLLVSTTFKLCWYALHDVKSITSLSIYSLVSHLIANYLLVLFVLLEYAIVLYALFK